MKKEKKRKTEQLFGGALIGTANGAFGGGGGMLAVPLLRAGGLPTQKAHATAIAVILPASLVSGAVYFAGGLVPLNLLVPTALGVVLGGYFGAKLLGVVPERILNFVFALLMVLAGAKMLF